MKDNDIYVRKCCGPYVVAYLAYTYPRIVVPWLKRQARSTDLNVRANVAKAFSQSLGTRRPEDGVAILIAALVALDTFTGSLIAEMTMVGLLLRAKRTAPTPD